VGSLRDQRGATSQSRRLGRHEDVRSPPRDLARWPAGLLMVERKSDGSVGA